MCIDVAHRVGNIKLEIIRDVHVQTSYNACVNIV